MCGAGKAEERGEMRPRRRHGHCRCRQQRWTRAFPVKEEVGLVCGRLRLAVGSSWPLRRGSDQQQRAHRVPGGARVCKQKQKVSEYFGEENPAVGRGQARVAVASRSCRRGIHRRSHQGHASRPRRTQDEDEHRQKADKNGDEPHFSPPKERCHKSHPLPPLPRPPTAEMFANETGCLRSLWGAVSVRARLGLCRVGCKSSHC
jgi:hypothetical protein